ncbi:Hypothetical predicted protein [Marmota monax]|uniref:Schlafen AlbA-2 domain-containing protein n=1 Tax=Marmota monax TaxID=9995 RepID=A0A5E4BBY4_MARMO|nr:Hypothetical predicted protein [Marmota monax]
MFPAALSQCVKERLARCVSALASAEGGYVFLGVHDETHQVIGCEKEKTNLSKFKNSVERCIRKLPVRHFCTQRHTTQCSIRFLEVHDKGALSGYVCAVKVERFCCVVFSKVPNAWQLKANKVKPLTTKQWVDWMMQAKPGEFGLMLYENQRTFQGCHSRAEKMSLKIDLETNFAEFVIDAGEVILGTQQRTDMNPPLLRVKHNENILLAVCALLNSGGGVIKAKIKDEDYNHEIHEEGLDLPPVFEGYLDEMQQGKLFLIFVTSWNTEVSALSQCVKERLARCVSALASAEGGYVFLGVHDETHQVIGCEKEKINLSKFKNSVECCIRKLPVRHFCTQRHTTQCSIRFLEVHDKGALSGYVCAVKVERFCCVVFSKVPNAWQLKANKVKPLTTKQWVDWMMQAKPVHRRLSEMFLELSLSPSMPPSRTVCTQNLERLKVLQKRHFPVSSHRVVYTPESLYQELCSEHKGLRDLIDREMCPVSRGILIFSRSWAVDLGLKENQGVICDALLISQNNTPILYTVFRKWDERFNDDSMKVASSLKQRLVDTGGYTGRVCIVPLFFQLNLVGTPVTPHSSVAQIYPESYNLTTIQHMETLLRSLVRVLFGFKSFVSEELGSETWNLLTDQQYELLSKNLHKTRQLFVHGLPGSGKTTVALKVMQKIRNVFHCEPHEILYVCENQPQKKFVSNKKICKAVTRK